MNFFDLHCDTLTEAAKQGVGLRCNGLQLDLAKLPEGILAQMYAIFIPDTLRGEAAWQYFGHCTAYGRSLLKNEEKIRQVNSAGEIETLWQSGCHAMMLSVEGGAVLGGEIRRVQALADAGVRTLTLTWNGANELGSGAGAAGGLTPFGREVLREMVRYSIVPDVSHLNDETFWDVMGATDAPVAASHSNSRKLCPVPRNLTDDQFCAIAERVGLVGLNYYPAFLCEMPEQATMDDLLRHAEHFLLLGGEDVLALGSDFDGASMPQDLPDCGRLPLLAERLTDAFGKPLAEKICWRNALRFMESCPKK